MPVLTKINTNVIADNAVTAAKTDQGADSSLSGTISGQRLQLSDEFTLTGDLTVNDDLVLGKVTDDGTGQSLTGSGKTITGTGTLTMGSSVTDRVKEFNQLTGNVTAPSLILTPSSAPSSPSEGQLYYNDADNVVKVYNGSAWDQLSNTFTATGGTVVTSGGYKYHTFTSSGSFTASATGYVSVFMIGGGGGGGGARYGGGGGAGGLIWIENMSLTAQTCVIVIGAGGDGEGGNVAILDKTNGVDTTMTRSAGNLTAKGGGWGASADNTSTTYGLGNIGGCGGGGQNYNSGSDNFGTSNQSSQSGDSGTYGIGFSGGRGYTSPSFNGGGGGGLSEAGVSATNTAGGTSGRGGHGVHTLSGLSQAQTTTFLAAGAASQSEVVSGIRYIGAGGGAGGHNPVSDIGSGNRVPGGSGFGGDGGVQGSKSAGLSAPINSGSGGGSATVSTSTNTTAGGDGGSGIVIIRYAI